MLLQKMSYGILGQKISMKRNNSLGREYTFKPICFFCCYYYCKTNLFFLLF